MTQSGCHLHFHVYKARGKSITVAVSIDPRNTLCLVSRLAELKGKMTVHYNRLTKEPYLRLPTPLSNIIITPHRLENIDETATALAEILNDPQVYLWLEGTPYPYQHEDGVKWIKANCKENEDVLSALRRYLEQHESISNSKSAAVASKQDREYLDSCPFTCIREVLEEDAASGTPVKDRLIGDMKLARYTFYEHPHDSEERSVAQRRNNALPTGDENIIWVLGGT